MNSFTTVDDVNQLILLEMDIDSLSTYCQTHKNNCNDIHFWRKKFKYDSLPFDLEEYPTTMAEWIRTYRLLHQAKKDVKYILLMIGGDNYDTLISIRKSIYLSHLLLKENID